jgi:hypothetical protein
MNEEKLLQLLNHNPQAIKTIANPTEEMMKLAVQANGLLLAYLQSPSRQVESLALANNPRAIKFIKNPTEEMMQVAIEKGWSNLQYIAYPTEKIINLALSQSGWAIEYVKNPTEEMQLLAVQKNNDALKYIESPTEKVILTALKGTPKLFRLLTPVTKEQASYYLAHVISVIDFLDGLLSTKEIEEILKKVIAQEDVEEEYIRLLIQNKTIDRVSSVIAIDKIQLIDRYGSLRAKKITVDERLKG